jgi:N-acylneuraminate cytidylyltransferase
VVATDCERIEDVVNDFHLKKISIYKRSKDNASDTATTESVMLEYINQSNLRSSDHFTLVQATSPLVSSLHFDEAFESFSNGESDSVLSCVRTKRFFWKQNGTPINYDFKSRPRRQDFDGILMENGAFYISTVGKILESNNRLSGKISIYEMPEYTAVEIDEPDDILLVERLMAKYLIYSKPMNIKLFLSDVDGTLTDGGMYYSENGDELKRFDTRDGKGFELLRNSGLKTGIITSESTEIVRRRFKKLKLDYLYQGMQHGGKLEAAKAICEKENITLEEVAYIGDDVNCFELLSEVGIKACPSNSVEKIMGIPNIIKLNHAGGNGAVREFAEIILNNSR